MVRGMPERLSNGVPVNDSDGKQKYTTWRLSDLDLARHMFSVKNSDDDTPMVGVIHA